jgi:hypothetical protein
MTEQFSQEQLDKETDAMILQMRRSQATQYIKFGAIMVLVFMGFFAITYLALSIPAAVMAIMGQ